MDLANAKDSRRKISMNFQSSLWKQDKLIFPQILYFLFRFFRRSEKQRIVGFSQTVRLIRDILWIVIKVLEVYKMCAV